MDDRDVISKGSHLANKSIDFIVGGGIAAVEAVKIIRELRRYGASVRVVMTKSALSFVQPLVFEWASKNKVITELSGSAEHLSPSDAAVVFPATFNLVGRLAQGLADDSALTTLQGLLGRFPIILCPSMHERLWENPLFQKNWISLRKMKNIFCVEPIVEEGKRKGASMEEIVQKTIGALSTSLLKNKAVVLSAGATRSAIDDVRFVSNDSSGSTGLAIAEELFRRGARVFVAQGRTKIDFPSWIVSGRADTVLEMQKTLQKYIRDEKPIALIMAAALLDFEVKNARRGKLSSSKNLIFEMMPTAKVIDSLQGRGMKKIGFKLEAGLTDQDLAIRVAEWNQKKKCDLVIANERKMISDDRQKSQTTRAILFDSRGREWARAQTNKDLAIKICDWLENRDSKLR